MTEKNTFAKLLDAVATAKENKDKDKPKDDLNILQMPLTQEIKENNNGKWVQWVWEPVGLGIKIYGILYVGDYEELGLHGKKQNSGDYEVQLSLGDRADIYIYDPVIAKEIGHAIVSASHWVNVWKEHAGHFMELELFGYGTEKEIDEV